MKKRIKVYNIDWCVEEEDVCDCVNYNDKNYIEKMATEIKNIKSELPKETDIMCDEDFENKNDLEYFICEYLSNTYGWLVNSFSYENV